MIPASWSEMLFLAAGRLPPTAGAFLHPPSAAAWEASLRKPPAALYISAPVPL